MLSVCAAAAASAGLSFPLPATSIVFKRVCASRGVTGILSSVKPSAFLLTIGEGTYTAPVQIWNEATLSWVDKKNISTFFPPSWSEARIAYEVAEAFKNKIPNPAGGWKGTTVGGIDIQFYWDVKNQRTTFYPLEKP